jgi:hypothetical protein
MIASLLGDGMFFDEFIGRHLNARGLAMAVPASIWRNPERFLSGRMRLLILKLRDSTVAFGRGTVSNNTPGISNTQISLAHIGDLERRASNMPREAGFEAWEGFRMQLVVRHMRTRDDAGLNLGEHLDVYPPMHMNRPGLWGPAELGPVTHLMRHMHVTITVEHGVVVTRWCSVEPVVFLENMRIPEARFAPCFGALPRPAGVGPREEVAWLATS